MRHQPPGRFFTSSAPPRSPPAPARCRHRWAALAMQEDLKPRRAQRPRTSAPAAAYSETCRRSGTRDSGRSPAASAGTSRGSPPPACCETAPPRSPAPPSPLTMRSIIGRKSTLPPRRSRTGTAPRTNASAIALQFDRRLPFEIDLVAAARPAPPPHRTAARRRTSSPYSSRRCDHPLHHAQPLLGPRPPGAPPAPCR